MALILKLGLHLLCIWTLAFAIPVSLLEDIKDAQLQSPLRTNKVKRAQEVLMFGNQQNRAINNYGNQRPEKRDVGDNSLAEDVATLPNILPQVEEQGYDTNQLESGEKAYPYIGTEPTYGMVLRNAAFKESLHNDPVMNYGDLPMYNMMDSRRKRDAHKAMPSSPKTSYRSKRDYDLSPEELVSLMRLLENQRKQGNRFHDQSENGWPFYGADGEDLDMRDNQDEDDDIEAEYNRNGIIMNGPVPLTPSQQANRLWPRKYKRFMVSKRRSDTESLPQINYLPYDFPEGLAIQRRFIL